MPNLKEITQNLENEREMSKVLAIILKIWDQELSFKCEAYGGQLSGSTLEFVYISQSATHMISSTSSSLTSVFAVPPPGLCRRTSAS